jgi:hypothetical protein
VGHRVAANDVTYPTERSLGGSDTSQQPLEEPDGIATGLPVQSRPEDPHA